MKMEQQTIGAKVFDSKKHEMVFKTKKVDARIGETHQDLQFCDMCLDEIDLVLGYFVCEICNIDRCKECGLNERKMDMQLAENPFCVATPLLDLKGTSYTQKRQILFSGMIMKEISENSSEYNRMLLNTKATEVLLDDKNLEFELARVGISKDEFDFVSKKLFEEAKEQLQFQARPGIKIDQKVGKLVRLLKVNDIPVIGIADNVFLIGIYKLPIQQRGDYL